MRRKITSLEIEELRGFIRRKYVRYLDAELELIDHFATAAEARWEEDSDYPLRLIIQETYKKFGIFGFSRYIEEKTKQVYKSYWKRIVTEIFRSKSLCLFCMIFLANIALMTILSVVSYKQWIYYGLLIGVFLVVGLKNIRIMKKIQFRKLIGASAHGHWCLLFFQIAIQGLIIPAFFNAFNVISLLWTTVTSMMILVVLIESKLLDQYVDSLEENFPEFLKSSK